MITTSTLWLDISLGLLAAGLVFGALLFLTWWDRRRQERAAAQLHVPQHRALDSAPVEAIRLPVTMDWLTRPPFEQERTEEHEAVDGTPVVHLGADEDWSPTAELEMVPARPLDPDEAADVEYAEQLRRELDAVLGPVLDQLARVGHEESYTCEWTAEEINALVAAGRPR